MRHSDDEGIDATYRHDAKISNSGALAVMKYTRELITKNGLPEIIFCSPFRRCKYTVKYMMKVMRREFNYVPKIIIDPRLSRYFSPAEQRNPQIGVRTAKHNVPIKETGEQFRSRADSFIIDIERYKDRKNIWIVTHTLVLRQVARRYRRGFPGRIPFLYTMRV